MAEHQLALGNVIGSNLFNTLAVVGTAGLIAPALLDRELVTRDLPVMFAFTAVLIVMAYGWGRRSGVINKYEGGGLLLAVRCPGGASRAACRYLALRTRHRLARTGQ